MTTRIKVDDYCAEWLRAKYAGDDGIIYLPDDLDLYHLLWDLMARRPVDVSPIDEGNIEIFLPCRREGKKPSTFNYIYPKSQRLFNQKVKSLISLDLHTYVEAMCSRGIMLIDAIGQYKLRYQIDSISDEALLKNIQRWRNKLYMRSYRRKYKSKGKKRC